MALFGYAGQSQPSLFTSGGNQPSQPSLFGGPQQQPPPSLSLFGTGQSQSQPSLSLFPTNQQPQQQTSLFGSTQQPSQQSQPFSLFGSSQNQPQSQSFSLFGTQSQQQQQPSFSLFGQTTQPQSQVQQQILLFNSSSLQQPSQQTVSLIPSQSLATPASITLSTPFSHLSSNQQQLLQDLMTHIGTLRVNHVTPASDTQPNIDEVELRVKTLAGKVTAWNARVDEAMAQSHYIRKEMRNTSQWVSDVGAHWIKYKQANGQLNNQGVTFCSTASITNLEMQSTHQRLSNLIDEISNRVQLGFTTVQQIEQLLQSQYALENANKAHALEDSLRHTYEYLLVVAAEVSRVKDALSQVKHEYLTALHRVFPEAGNPFLEADKREEAESKRVEASLREMMMKSVAAASYSTSSSVPGGSPAGTVPGALPGLNSSTSQPENIGAPGLQNISLPTGQPQASGAFSAQGQPGASLFGAHSGTLAGSPNPSQRRSSYSSRRKR